VQTQFLFGGDFSERKAEHEQTVVNLEVERPFGDKLNGELLVTYADAGTDATGFFDGAILGVGPFLEREDTSSADITAKVDGELARFRSGALMFALGAGYSEDEYAEFSDFSAANGSAPSGVLLDRNTTYAFAELLLPIVSPEQNVSGIRRLEFSLAGRYTDYSDFGDDASPKIGVLWSPVSPLTIRGTLGESFKAPFLTEKNPSGGQNAFFPQAALGFPDIWTPDDSAVILFAQGPGNPVLQAENAKTVTFGFDFDFLGGDISATYFDIEYTDRIAEPDSTGGFTVLGNPQGFPDLFNMNPTLEEVSALLAATENFLNLTGIDIGDPAAVHAATTALFDNRIRNLSISELNGLDLSVEYTTTVSAGDLSFGAKASKVFEFEERITRNAATLSRVDTVLFPADLKGRAYVGFQKDRWYARLNVNYVDDYDNPFDAANPTVDDWTTVDLLFSYEFPTDGNGMRDGVRLDFTIQNTLDEDPPFLPVSPTTNTGILNPTGFDPANANPIGRYIDFKISKRW
jgi:outer membrane receptor protein involved in Fe transport